MDRFRICPIEIFFDIGHENLNELTKNAPESNTNSNTGRLIFYFAQYITVQISIFIVGEIKGTVPEVLFMPLLMTIFSTSFMRGYFSEDKKDTVLVRETRTRILLEPR